MEDRRDEQAVLRKEMEALAPWFQNIHLGGGLQTAAEHFLGDYPSSKYARFAGGLPADLSGKSVLDIGCNAGFYSIEMKRRGAALVVGIDSDERYLAQARLASKALGCEAIEYVKMSVYDVAALGRRFDLVLFMGVFYHLRHPLLALDLIREHAASDLLLFQTMHRGAEHVVDVPHDHPFHVPGTFDPPGIFDEAGYPRMHFIEREYAGDWTNWWAPNRACSEAMLRASGFRVESRLEAEVYLCRVAPVPYAEYGPAVIYPAQGVTR